MTQSSESTLSQLKREMRKVRREYEDILHKQDWAMSQYLAAGDDSQLKAVDAKMKALSSKRKAESGVKNAANGPVARSQSGFRESAILDIQERTLSALATRRLEREELSDFVSAEISNLRIAEALDAYEGLATLEDEEANAKLIERMFRAAQRGKKSEHPVDLAAAAIRLARLLLTNHITSWACAIVDGTVPSSTDRGKLIRKGQVAPSAIALTRAAKSNNSSETL